MTIPIYQADAFTGQLFGGNPAAVCPLEEWLPDEVMQKIAIENNLAETAFFVKQEEGYKLRWFTPGIRDRPLRSCHAGLGAHTVYPVRF